MLKLRNHFSVPKKAYNFNCILRAQILWYIIIPRNKLFSYGSKRI